MFSALALTLRAPLYHVWVARVTQGKGGAERGEEDRGHIICFLNTDLISRNTNMQRNTETALKTRMEPSSTKHLSIISLLCLSYLQSHTLKSTGEMPQNIQKDIDGAFTVLLASASCKGRSGLGPSVLTFFYRTMGYYSRYSVANKKGTAESG